MKYDLNKKPTKFAERVLVDFTVALFDTLQEKPLENISVSELCQKAVYPRATFYNYFEDIFDLLEYGFYRLTRKIEVEDVFGLPPKERTVALFRHCYAYLASNEQTLQRVMKQNTMDGLFAEYLHKYVKREIYRNIVEHPYPGPALQISREIAAEHTANTIEMLLKHCFLAEKKLSQEEAISTLKNLLGL